MEEVISNMRWYANLNDDGTCGITRVEEADWKNPPEIRELIVPSTIEGHEVVSVRMCCSYQTSATSYVRKIIFPSTLKEPSRVCWNSAVEEYAIAGENELFSIHDGMLFSYDMTQLFDVPDARREVVVPEGVTVIAQDAFRDKRIEKVHFPDTLIEIKDHAFCNSTLKGFIAPKSLRKIGEAAFFRNYRLEDVHLNEGLEEIGEKAFLADSSILGIDIPKTLVHIGRSAFSGATGIGDVVLGPCVRSVGSAFSGSSIKSVVIPASVDVIDAGAFCGCRALESVVIGNPNVELSDDAFGGCPELKSIKCAGVAPLGSPIRRLEYFTSLRSRVKKLLDGPGPLYVRIEGVRALGRWKIEAINGELELRLDSVQLPAKDTNEARANVPTDVCAYTEDGEFVGFVESLYSLPIALLLGMGAVIRVRRTSGYQNTGRGSFMVEIVSKTWRDNREPEILGDIPLCYYHDSQGKVIGYSLPGDFVYDALSDEYVGSYALARFTSRGYAVAKEAFLVDAHGKVHGPLTFEGIWPKEQTWAMVKDGDYSECYTEWTYKNSMGSGLKCHAYEYGWVEFMDSAGAQIGGEDAPWPLPLGRLLLERSWL